MGQKRKRLALSCVDCRRRKVKCDRTYPVCVRCQKSNNAENCTYVSHTGLEPGLPTPSEDSPEQQQHAPPAQVAPSGEPYVVAALRELSPHLEVQSRRPLTTSNPPQHDVSADVLRNLFGRAAQLETYTRTPGTKPVAVRLFADLTDSTAPAHERQTDPASEFGKVLVRGKNFSTHYYGPSFAISMLLQFEELSRFVKGMLSAAPSLTGVKERMAATRAAAKQFKQQSTYIEPPDLISMVPERSTVDKLVNVYLDKFETTYRVVHVPLFRRDYEAYWKDPSSVSSGFVVILLLIMACVNCVMPDSPIGFCGRSSFRREVGMRWIEAGESWLNEQSQKHVKLQHFQAHTLIFLAKAILCVKVKREWVASGSLLRLAMAIGMHREPSLLSKRIDVFDQEMRRRLWFTIVELDLLTSVARGMPPTIDPFNWDCAAPRNIDDEDFDENTQELPPSKSKAVFTRSSYLHVAAESLPLRIEVLGRINSIRLGFDLDSVMQYDSKLRDIIDSLPDWKNHVNDDLKTARSTAFARNLTRLTLYDYILILHIPFASQTALKSKSFYSVASKRDVSYKTLQIYAQMDAQERLMLADIRDDGCRASLALAHDMTTSLERNDAGLHHHDQALSYLGTVVETCERRFLTLGQGFHTFWITLSAYNLLRWKFSPSQEPSEAFAQDAANRVTDLQQKIIGNQVPLPLPNGDMPPHNPGMTTGTSIGTDGDAFSVSGSTMDSNNCPPNTGGGKESSSTGVMSLNAPFPGFDQINFFDDPFSDMNFDLSQMWNFEV